MLRSKVGISFTIVRSFSKLVLIENVGMLDAQREDSSFLTCFLPFAILISGVKDMDSPVRARFAVFHGSIL